MAGRFRRLLRHSILTGALSLAIGSGLSAVGLAVHWSRDPGQLIMHLFLVPLVAVAGAAIGLVLMPLVQCMASLLRIGRDSWPLTDAILATILACIVVLPWAAWVAGGVAAALHGRQGVYVLFAAAGFAGLSGGVLFGRAMRRYDEKISQDSM